jgi:Uma2 family endonuclease
MSTPVLSRTAHAMSTALQTRYTPADLLTMPDGDRYELVDGELVELNMSFLSSYVAGEIHRRLANHSVEHRQAWVAPEGASYQCFPDSPNKVRKPDTSAIRLERLSTADAMAAGHMTILPDLAVEVTSPGDSAYEVDEKIQDYLDAGVPLVWEVNPELRTIVIYRADGTLTRLGENDEITGENVLPGFRCRVGEFFRLPST